MDEFTLNDRREGTMTVDFSMTKEISRITVALVRLKAGDICSTNIAAAARNEASTLGDSAEENSDYRSK